jgi:hypothetical protein
MTTRLDNNIKDFKLVRDEEGNVTHWIFRFGECEDFHEALREFKEKIPHKDRKPQPEKKWLWTVTANQTNFYSLCDIFDNFQECEHVARAQMDMFRKAK